MGLLIIYLIGVFVSVVVMAWLKVNSSSEFFEDVFEQCPGLAVFMVLIWFLSWPVTIAIIVSIKTWKFLIHTFEKRKEMKDLKEQKVE